MNKLANRKNDLYRTVMNNVQNTENNLKTLITKARKTYVNKKIEENRSSMKCLWVYVVNKICNKSPNRTKITEKKLKLKQ